MPLATGAELMALIRNRPAMFIGSTDVRGLYGLAQKVIGPAVTETVARGGGTVSITLHADGSLSAQDHGTPVPTEPDPVTGLPRFATSLCEMETDRKQPSLYGRSFNYPLALGWFSGFDGLAPLNALSERLEVAAHSDGTTHLLRFEQGVLQEYRQQPADESAPSLHVRFLPAWPLFACDWSQMDLQDRLRKLAYLLPELLILFEDEARGTRQELHEPEGALALLRSQSNDPNAPPPVRFTIRTKGWEADLALHFQYQQWELFQAYANTIQTNGGFYNAAFRDQLARLIANAVADLPPSADRPSPDFRKLPGLAAILSLRLPAPDWGGATRTILGNREVGDWVRHALDVGWQEWQQRDPEAVSQMAYAARELAWWSESYRQEYRR